MVSQPSYLYNGNSYILAYCLYIEEAPCFSLAILLLIGWVGTSFLTHWGRVTHICISKLTIIGSDNGLTPDRHQAIIRTNVDLLLIGPLETNVNEILMKIRYFQFTKMHLKMSYAKWCPFCLRLNVLIYKDGFLTTCPISMWITDWKYQYIVMYKNIL